MKKTIFLFPVVTIAAVFLIFSMNAFAQKTGVADKSTDTSPLVTGEVIPNVTVKNISGELVELNSLVSAKPTILIFYRGGWCPFCNTQLLGLKKIESDLTAMGYQLIAISADKPEKLKETLTKDELGYTLLSDYNSEAAISFGLAFRVDDETVEKYKGYGINLDETSGNSNHILPVPAVYLIDMKGMIKFDYSNPDYKIRLDADELLKAAKSNK